MANTIKIKNSGTASAVPTSLEYGELGLNYADGKLYYKNLSNNIVQLAGAGSTSLDGLSDVIVTSPEEFQGLSYNGTEWVNSHIPLVSYVRNAESTTITTGTCVYLFGSTGDHATVKRADNSSDTTSSKTVGVVGANISASQNGPIITRGYVDGIDLSTGYTAGDVLWLGKNGAFTTTKPSSPDHLVFIGVVVRATNNGIIYVATQNGYELDEIHNVQISNTLASGDFLKYNGTLWVNDPINLGTDTVGNYMTDVSAGTGISISHTPSEGSTATITNSGVTGITGTANQISASSSTGSVTLSLPTNITVSGNVTANTNLVSNFSSGDEGGEIALATPQSNTTLSGPVKVDIYQNKIRFFESGGSARGAYIDLTAAGSGASTNLLGTAGAMNYEQQQSGKVSNVSSNNATIVSRSFTTNGYPVQVMVTGDAENSTAGGWIRVQLFRDSTAIGKGINIESSAGSENVPYALTVIDTPSAGTYTYSLKTVTAAAAGSFNFGEVDGPVLTMIELAGRTGATGPTGPAGASGATTLDGLTDVTAPTPSSGDFLKYNGSAWVNDAIDLSTDTTGSYVSSLVAGTGITLTNNSGEGSTPTVAVNTSTVVTLTDTQTLSNKTLSSPTILGSISLPQYIIFEGSVDDAYETVLSVVEPTADRLITLPNATGTLAIGQTVETNSNVTFNTVTVTGSVVDHVSINQQTASYTLVLTDDKKLVEMNVGSANNLTVPADNTVNFPVGTSIDILQVGAGQTTIVASSGVTINRATGLKLRAQWSAATLIKRAANTWVAVGDLSA